MGKKCGELSSSQNLSYKIDLCCHAFPGATLTHSLSIKDYGMFPLQVTYKDLADYLLRVLAYFQEQ